MYIGIDGGGSSLRVAAVDESLNVIAQTTSGTASPSGIGRERSAALIQESVRAVVATLDSRSIQAVGIGVAGASPLYADDWLRATVAAVLPDVPTATATDVEIALVGARGERRGIIVAAGTGSVAFGVNDAGKSVQVGGWGYLLGDEGSGYWIAQEALRWITQQSNVGESLDTLAQRLLEQIGFEHPHELISWLYRQPTPVRETAALASVVLSLADQGDTAAARIVRRAAEALALLVHQVERRLHIEASTRQIAFGGGLLTSDTPLSQALCDLLGLPARPEALYPPVVGAALLAKIRYS